MQNFSPAVSLTFPASRPLAISSRTVSISKIYRSQTFQKAGEALALVAVLAAAAVWIFILKVTFNI